MIPNECKRLAEVDFPIGTVSRHSSKEKSIRSRHSSTFHLWWARRPLAACRSVLLALLLPDPCDENCPETFRADARRILSQVQGTPGSGAEDLRKALLRFIGDFADWNNAEKSVYLSVARSLVRAAYGNERPLVVDPFSGGGSIPLEALRVGCDAFASDLNPVACLVLRAMLEDIPRYGVELAEKLTTLAASLQRTAAVELSRLFPAEVDGGQPIAYLWARSVVCDTCGCDLPLVRSFWLSTKKTNSRALRFSVAESKGCPPKLLFSVFEPKDESEVAAPTISDGKATCPVCKNSMSAKRVKVQLTQQSGGTDAVLDGNRRIGGANILVVVVRTAMGVRYRVPNDDDWSAVKFAHDETQRLKSVNSEVFPNEPINPIRPSPNARGVSGATRIGITDFGKLFTFRQKLTLTTMGRLIQESEAEPTEKRMLLLAVSKLSERVSSFVTWINSTQAPRGTFSRQALTIAWDFVELVAVNAEEEFLELVEAMCKVINHIAVSTTHPAVVVQASATASPLPDEEASVWFTDPPYYDSVPYADLSDYFFVWQKRILPSALSTDIQDETSFGLVPKAEECTWDAAHKVNGIPKTPAFFEAKMGDAFAEGRRVLSNSGTGCVVFAHKTTEGWEALLAGMMKARWIVNASWPIKTERGARLNARNSAALATSVHLICRPRAENAPIGEWAEVFQELPIRVGNWFERLQTEGIRGADLVFACIGPAMEIYSRYTRVEDAEGRDIPLGGDPTAIEPYKRGFLAYVWETVGRLALEQVLGTAEAKARNGTAGALEEDSRLTALFLWTLEATESETDDIESKENDDDVDDEEDDEEKPKKKKKAGLSLIYDVARRFAQPLGIHLDKWEGRIIETEKGVVRLLPVGERATQLFGESDASAMAHRIEQDVKASRNYTFAFMQDVAAPPEIKPRGRGKAKAAVGTVSDVPPPQMITTLDRLHAAMLLQSSGQSNGLRAMLKEEQQRGPDFLRLANSLSALYPKDSEEKRLLDAMLLAVPRN